jgi:hypothetical protein
MKKGSDLGVGIEVEETINTECDDIEETTADRNEVKIRQLSHTETEEPCDVENKHQCQSNFQVSLYIELWTSAGQ